MLLFFVAAFLILLVLVQRGKGGGLAGAFGGLGGQSAFGTKAGDTFTRITIGTAAVWILLCIISVRVLAPKENLLNLGQRERGLIPAAPEQPANPGETPAGGEAGTSAPSSGTSTPVESPDSETP